MSLANDMARGEPKVGGNMRRGNEEQDRLTRNDLFRREREAREVGRIVDPVTVNLEDSYLRWLSQPSVVLDRNQVKPVK
jgi:hypothetical protein